MNKAILVGKISATNGEIEITIKGLDKPLCIYKSGNLKEVLNHYLGIGKENNKNEIERCFN